MHSSLGIWEILIASASRFHGHSGPFLALGIRAGMRAIEFLGYNPFEMKVYINTPKKTPFTCFVDGVQFITSCTLGKGNIEIIESNDLYAVFERNGRRMKISVKKKRS